MNKFKMWHLALITTISFALGGISVWTREPEKYPTAIQSRLSWIEKCTEESMSRPVNGQWLEYTYPIKYEKCAESYDKVNK